MLKLRWMIKRLLIFCMFCDEVFRRFRQLKLSIYIASIVLLIVVNFFDVVDSHIVGAEQWQKDAGVRPMDSAPISLDVKIHEDGSSTVSIAGNDLTLTPDNSINVSGNLVVTGVVTPEQRHFKPICCINKNSKICYECDMSKKMHMSIPVSDLFLNEVARYAANVDPVYATSSFANGSFDIYVGCISRGVVHVRSGVGFSVSLNSVQDANIELDINKIDSSFKVGLNNVSTNNILKFGMHKISFEIKSIFEIDVLPSMSIGFANGLLVECAALFGFNFIKTVHGEVRGRVRAFVPDKKYTCEFRAGPVFKVGYNFNDKLTVFARVGYIFSSFTTESTRYLRFVSSCVAGYGVFGGVLRDDHIEHRELNIGVGLSYKLVSSNGFVVSSGVSFGYGRHKLRLALTNNAMQAIVNAHYRT